MAQLLNKLLVEQTKVTSAAQQRYGLVETKNGAVIRKHMGYGYIAAGHAESISRFYREHLNLYVNLHRPCAQADIEVDAKGRTRDATAAIQTPLGRLLAMARPEPFLRLGVSLDLLQQQVARHSLTKPPAGCG